MHGTAPFWIIANDPDTHFPDSELALKEPDGLLAVGGDLSPERLESAYKSGIFPWYNHDQPILWWSPNPRAVLFPDKLHLSKSLQKVLNKKKFELSFDVAFDRVIEACSQPRGQESSTWITSEMHQAYNSMHRRGHAHSVEAWQNGKLVGGLYGLAFGKVFFGESMFSLAPNASKVAFAHLVEHLLSWGFTLVDCQISSAHLSQFGAENISRKEFTIMLQKDCIDTKTCWQIAQ
ncbi:MAG: leucyl/phenylalanyl-tRNA--protein transferase [Thiohalomonadales bacterium]